MESNQNFKIYTKTGDDGTSGLIGGTRVEKYDERLEAYGTIDELNSWIGLIRTGQHEKEVQATLEFIQNKLFEIGSHLATDASQSTLKNRFMCSDADISVLEKEVDRMQVLLPELKNFILPGGSISAGYTHVARTVCRRSERRISSINKQEEIQKNVLIFINRLSDYLFVLARFINFKQGNVESIWNTSKT
ncbi:MAG: cob(I)yrinic acid a,c-diamide adenosyltransferase [Prolixibacteraceae bacterium]